jgi:hypothetical protein
MRSSSRYHLLELRSPGQIPLFLAAVHLPSRLRREESDIAEICRILNDDLSREEARLNHRNTIVVGDFNLDPFSPAMNSVTGMNAVHTRALASKMSRTFAGETYPFFYNPMWRFMHDAHGGPPGTYYYSESGVRSTYWRTFDQALLRPELVPRLRHDSVEIVTEASGKSLMKPTGTPGHVTGFGSFPDHA